jgi:hypothetical protein
MMSKPQTLADVQAAAFLFDDNGLIGTHCRRTLEAVSPFYPDGTLKTRHEAALEAASQVNRGDGTVKVR